MTEDEKQTSEKKVEDKDESKERSTEQETKEEPEILTKDDLINILKSIPGVGQVMAEHIYDAGYDTQDKFRSLTMDDLKKVKGIGQAMAEKIVAGMENAIKQSKVVTEEEKEGAKGPGIAAKTMGLITETVSKIRGFFKGKSPNAKPKSKDNSTDETGSVSVKTGEPEDEGEGAKKDVDNKDTYFPEVGKDTEIVEDPPKHEPVTVEPSDTEPGYSPLHAQDLPEETSPEIIPESEPEPKYEQEPEQKASAPEPVLEPEINLIDPSGLLKWFEISQNLNSHTGKLIFKAGYNNLEELQEAVVEDLILVQDITRQEAEKICEELKKL